LAYFPNTGQDVPSIGWGISRKMADFRHFHRLARALLNARQLPLE
jgi:hypothetical protein